MDIRLRNFLFSAFLLMPSTIYALDATDRQDRTSLVGQHLSSVAQSQTQTRAEVQEDRTTGPSHLTWFRAQRLKEKLTFDNTFATQIAIGAEGVATVLRNVNLPRVAGVFDCVGGVAAARAVDLILLKYFGPDYVNRYYWVNSGLVGLSLVALPFTYHPVAFNFLLGFGGTHLAHLFMGTKRFERFRSEVIAALLSDEPAFTSQQSATPAIEQKADAKQASTRSATSSPKSKSSARKRKSRAHRQHSRDVVAA